MIALALALAAATARPLTLGEWNALPTEDAPAMLMAATEGVMLMLAGPHPGAVHADVACVGRINIIEIDRRLRARAKNNPNDGLVTAIMEESGCSR